MKKKKRWLNIHLYCDIEEWGHKFKHNVHVKSKDVERCFQSGTF